LGPQVIIADRGREGSHHSFRRLDDISVFGQHHFDFFLFFLLGLVVVAVYLSFNTGYALCAPCGLKFTRL
jgi:hypothetical protein